MPAIVHGLAPLTIVPSSVYLDTTVLRGAFRADPLSPATTGRHDLACQSFVAVLGANHPGTAWTSILAVEEAIWGPLRNQLGDAARNCAKAAHRRGPLTLSELKRAYPVGYAAAYNAARPATDHLLAFLRALPVAIREPRHPRFTSERAARAICFGVVGWMLRRYELEVADLFHIALAGLDGTNAIAGLDKGYRDVDGIIVYTCV